MTGDAEEPEATTTRDDGSPTTVDDGAPDTRVDPAFAEDAIAGLKAISQTIKMSDGDPIPDPAPRSLSGRGAARLSSPSDEAITLKNGKPILAGAAATADAGVEPTVSDPAKTPAGPTKKRRTVQKTMPDDGADVLERTRPDPLPVEAAGSPRARDVATSDGARRAKRTRRKAPSPLSNPLVWLVGATMLAALVGLGIFLSSQGSSTTPKKEKTAKPTASPNLPQPEKTTPNAATTTTTPTAETPTTTETPPPTTTAPPRPTTTGPRPTPTTTSTTTPSPFPFPTVLPTAFPSFPGVVTPSPPTSSTSR